MLHGANIARVDRLAQVEAKKAVPRDEFLMQQDQPQHSVNAPGSDGGASRSKKIFVGGLAPTVDDKVLREFFEVFGLVEDAVVMYDHDSKRARGFGFVTFASEDAVEAVFAQGSMQSIHDKQIEIKSAVPRDQMPATSTARSPLHMHGPAAFPDQQQFRGVPYGGPMGMMGGLHNPHQHRGAGPQMGNQYGRSAYGTVPTVQPGFGRGGPMSGGRYGGPPGLGGHMGAPPPPGTYIRAGGPQAVGQGGKALPPSTGYEGLYGTAGGGGLSAANGNPSMFASAANTQAALAYMQQAQLNGMGSGGPGSGSGSSAATGPGATSAAAAFGGANNLENLKALALGFHGAFPSGPGGAGGGAPGSAVSGSNKARGAGQGEGSGGFGSSGQDGGLGGVPDYGAEPAGPGVGPLGGSVGLPKGPGDFPGYSVSQ